VAGAECWVQHNPRRLTSTTAAVEPGAVRARACFLCPEGLPPEERGLAIGDELVALCNPFPILDRHLVIVHRGHVPQRLAGRAGELLALARGLGPEDCVLYNGARCGASAPDHLHFQACSRARLPVEAALEGRELRRAGSGGWLLMRPEQCGRTVLALRSPRRAELAGWLEGLLAELPREADEAEPKLNLVCVHAGGSWTAYLFPRARHRPACFFAEGDARLLASPGAIDMAGVLVLPEQRDFQRIDAARLAAIYGEVTAAADAVAEAAARAIR